MLHTSSVHQISGLTVVTNNIEGDSGKVSKVTIIITVIFFFFCIFWRMASNLLIIKPVLSEPTFKGHPPLRGHLHLLFWLVKPVLSGHLAIPQG